MVDFAESIPVATWFKAWLEAHDLELLGIQDEPTRWVRLTVRSSVPLQDDAVTQRALSEHWNAMNRA